MVPALPVGDKGVISVHRGGQNCPQLISTAYIRTTPVATWPTGPPPMVESRFHDLRGHGARLKPHANQMRDLMDVDIAVRPLIQIRAASQKGDKRLPPGHSTNALIIYSLVWITIVLLLIRSRSTLAVLSLRRFFFQRLNFVRSWKRLFPG